MPLFCFVLFATYFAFGNSNSFAHHSFAMFDAENPIELVGTIREFKYTSPHSFIVLEVRENGTVKTWSLEGVSPSALVREGWSSSTLKPGDEVRMTVSPLRSGAPGGAWEILKTKHKDGSPITTHP
jgi:hypothetical protein